MQAFVHFTLFTLLFVISAASATDTSTASNVTTSNTTTAAPASTSTHAGDNTSTASSTTLMTPPGANNSTPMTPPGANNSTPTTPPGANNSTPATPPGANNSMPTTPPGANNSTPVPPSTAAPTGTDNTTPTLATPTAPTTFIKDNSLGTVLSVTSRSVTSPKTCNPNPDTTNLCRDDSCAGGSYCVNLNNTHFCQCIHGYYYNSSSCKKGKVFPGIIQIKIPDTSDLENERSINYENLYKEVTKFFKDVFTNSDYGQTVIEQVSISASARSQMRAGDKVVTTTVVNLFAEDTKENETSISNKINNAISNKSDITNYASQDRCEFYGCVKKNDCSDGFQCECQAGYERPNSYTATCLPLSRRCPYACNSKPNTQCLVKENGSPDCVCLAGYKKDDHEKCQVCAFGYKGVNCEDNFQLILTVLGTTAGILILGMVIALIFTRSKKTKDTEEQNLIENDFQHLKLQQTTGFGSPAERTGFGFPEDRTGFGFPAERRGFGSPAERTGFGSPAERRGFGSPAERRGFGSPAEGAIFPRITTSFPRDGGMQNPYGNSRGMPRPDY